MAAATGRKLLGIDLIQTHQFERFSLAWWRQADSFDIDQQLEQQAPLKMKMVLSGLPDEIEITSALWTQDHFYGMIFYGVDDPLTAANQRHGCIILTFFSPF